MAVEIRTGTDTQVVGTPEKPAPVKAQADILAGMDTAAKTAETQLKTLDHASVLLIGAWMKANYMKAGYKRLARLLVDSVPKTKA